MESLLEGYPRHPPPLHAEKSHILHVESRQVQSADAISTRGGGGGGGGRGKMRSGAIR